MKRHRLLLRSPPALFPRPVLYLPMPPRPPLRRLRAQPRVPRALCPQDSRPLRRGHQLRPPSLREPLPMLRPPPSALLSTRPPWPFDPPCTGGTRRNLVLRGATTHPISRDADYRPHLSRKPSPRCAS